jgi:hypothetical protein
MSELGKGGRLMQMLEEGFRSRGQPFLSRKTRKLREEPTHQAPG